MSHIDENPKPSLKDRLKPHLPAASIGLVTGMLVTVVLRPRSITNLVVGVNEPGSVLLGPELVKQVVQKGEAMFEIVPGLHVDIIDWGNPNVAER
jgi:hypothetical protein